MRYLNIFFLVIFISSLIFIGCSKKSSISEKIDRGLIALPKDRGVVYVGWRQLSSDPKDIGFNVYRMEIGKNEYEKVNDEPVLNSTNYVDREAVPGNAYRYKVKTVINGKEEETEGSAYVFAFPWDKPYISILFQGDYRAQNLAIADLDGDGKYDYVIKQPAFNTDPWREPGYWRRESLCGVIIWDGQLKQECGIHHTLFMILMMMVLLKSMQKQGKETQGNLMDMLSRDRNIWLRLMAEQEK